MGFVKHIRLVHVTDCCLAICVATDESFERAQDETAMIFKSTKGEVK